MVEQSASKSPHSASIAEKKNTSQFVGFQVDGQQYAFRIEQIQDEDLPRMQVEDEKIFNNELQEAIEVGFMARTAEMVAHAALLRKESRGHHLRTDYPGEDPNWLKHTVVEKKGRELICSTAPVVRLTE